MEGKLTYFKQYGAMRTGTNYLKRLVEINFVDVDVFGSILGWKHGMYDLDNRPDQTDSHVEWLNKKTKNNKVYSVDNHPLKYSYDALLSAAKNLNYLISIKKPHAFITSYKKFRFPNKPLTERHIIDLCHTYNTSYSRWKKLFLENKNTSLIVPHETVLHDYSHVLHSIGDYFKLSRISNRYTNETRPVKASTDHGLLIDRGKTFNTDYYIKQEYLKELSINQIKLIDDNINESLVDWFYNTGL